MATVSTVAAVAAPALAAKLSSVSNGACGSSCLVMVPAAGFSGSQKDSGLKVVAQADAAPSRVPDKGKRQLMNLLLLGAISLPTVGLAFPHPSSAASALGEIAKDDRGNDITVSTWLATHKAGDRTLVQGLNGDPTYLVVEDDGTLATYGVNAVCTHMGCVVPWNKNEELFSCPCHGSQYDPQGAVVRGPAPLSLALAHVNVSDGKVLFTPWVETDFRTDEEPWWAESS